MKEKLISQKEKNRKYNQKKFDLLDRLIDYAVRIIKFIELLPSKKITPLLQETAELISILFLQLVNTAKK